MANLDHNLSPKPKALASIRSVVLNTSTARSGGRPHFPRGRRVAVTLVSAGCEFKFKVGHKAPLFSAINNTDGTTTLRAPDVLSTPLFLTVAGSEIIRLATKANLHVDELFIDLQELFELHEEPQPDFIPPLLADTADDYADFATTIIGSYYDVKPTRRTSQFEQFEQDVALLWG